MPAPDWKARVHPELRSTLRRLPNLTFGPWIVRFFRLLEPLAPAPATPPEITSREVRVGAQRLLLYSPAGGPRIPGALLFIHGGGRVMGSYKGMARHCLRITRELGIVTASPSHRFAPEHPYPAALDDLSAAWRWLVEHAAELGVEPDRIAVGGESAGGGFAAELCQRLLDERTEGAPLPRAQLLIYPMLDDRTATDPALTEQGFLVWNNRSNRFAWSAYLGRPAGSPEVGRYASASRREDLSGLPPAWLTVGELDLFLAENRRYLERLEEAGVPTELCLIEGGFHGYFAVAKGEPPMERMWESLLAFLRQHL